MHSLFVLRPSNLQVSVNLTVLGLSYGGAGRDHTFALFIPQSCDTLT